MRVPVDWDIRPGGSGDDPHVEEPLRPEQFVVGDASLIAGENALECLEWSLADADEGIETGLEILRRAFPTLHAAIESTENMRDGPERDTTLRTAARTELERVLHASWRTAQLQSKTDPSSDLARVMDVPINLARKYAEGTHEAQDATNEEAALQSAHAVLQPPLFEVSNHHGEDRGGPPCVDGDEPNSYYGYFANASGEQSIFVRNYETREAFLRQGAADWDTVYPVIDAEVQGATLSECERAWIRACWEASGHSR